MPTEPKGLIFDIQGHSVHDGPGSRTTVFLNSCPLKCVWCCNPEGLFHKPVLLYLESRCKRCGRCIAACPHGGVKPGETGPVFDREICDKCTTHECRDACLSEALDVSGEYYTVPDLMKVLERDSEFWSDNGGVSFSGGEPLMQKEFITAALKACKERYMHTCVETTSCLATDYYLGVMDYVDWVFTDIKHMDSEAHRELTGVGNELILKNIGALAKKDWDGVIVPRIPVIPGKNDSEENIRSTAAFIREAGLDVVNLLPFHRLGESKYRQVGQVYKLAEMESPGDDDMKRLQKIAQDEGIYCFVGWETPF